MKGDFAVLDILGSAANKEIVSVEKIRCVSRNPNLTAASFKRTSVAVPEDLRDLYVLNRLQPLCLRFYLFSVRNDPTLI